MKKSFIRTTFITTVAALLCASCGLFSPEVELLLNMDGAQALGSASSSHSRAARDAEGDETPLELKKITKNGSEYVLNFVNANTENFKIKNVIKDPFGASKDVYVILENPAYITNQGLFPTQEMWIGQIMAIHEDGTFTSFPEVHGSNEYGWLFADGDISFDQEGNMYFLYNQIYYRGSNDEMFTNLYKYNPATRKCTVISDSVSGYNPSYKLSESHHWALVETNSNGLYEQDLYPVNGTAKKVHLNSFKKYYDASDFCCTFHHSKDILYYESIDSETGISTLYKVEEKDGAFNLKDKEVVLENSSPVGKQTIFSTESGIWSCSSPQGFTHLLDENDKPVGTQYENAIPHIDYTVDFHKSGNNILVKMESTLFCFDTINKNCVNILSMLPDAENLSLNSYSISGTKITYSATNKTTGQSINGTLDMKSKENTTLNSTENYTSIVLINEDTTE